MERYIFFFRQDNLDKVMMLSLPIGTSIDLDSWSGLFQGFKAELLRVASFTELVK